ncbi:MAG: patatin-like phospholipase family protein, partial [Gammaproteobacteria bacterium]
ERLPGVPPHMAARAQTSGLAGVRYVVGVDHEAMRNDALAALEREMRWQASRGHEGPLPTAVYLAVSGGGDKGAFGAGLLNGWTASGTRPQFKLVTGISTGALIAPFAFLGSAYDDQLRELYTKVEPRDIFKPRNLLSGLLGDAMGDTTPLRRLTEKYITHEFLAAIAAEHEKGRILLVGTTDLDARRGVIWNMTKIAAIGGPRALALFRSLLVASAAIPGAFPPVLVDVEIDGIRHQELHVDGGAAAQVFVYPPAVSSRGGGERQRMLYVVRNARLDPDWVEVKPRTLSIVNRAIASLIQSQGVGDLFLIHEIAQRDGLDFNMAYIPASFDAPHRTDFDTVYMNALYETAYAMAAKGYPWEKAPPGLDAFGRASAAEALRARGSQRPSP